MPLLAARDRRTLVRKPHCLATDARISDATAYRYLHEGLEVIAAHAPDLAEVVADAYAARAAYLCLDGTLVPTDRVAARAEAGHDLWYSGKHHRHGGSVQVLTDPTGFPLWVSAVRPGSVHDLTAARELALPSLYPHAARGLPVLADKGYTGAGIGVHTPVKHPPGGAVLHTDIRTYNRLLTALRAPTERAHALLGRWRALHRLHPGGSASSWPPLSCSPQCSEAAGEKTSIKGDPPPVMSNPPTIPIGGLLKLHHS